MKKSVLKLVQELELAKESLGKAEELERNGQNDIALVEYDIAIKKFTNVYKKNKEEAIKSYLQQSHISMGNIFGKIGLTKKATECYRLAAKLGSVEAQDKLKGASGNTTPVLSRGSKTAPPATPPAADNASKPLPSKDKSTPSLSTASQPKSGSSTPLLGRGSKAAPPAVAPIENISTSQSLAVFKGNPKPVVLNFKSDQKAKVQRT